MTKVKKVRRKITITELVPERDLELPEYHKVIVALVGAVAFVAMALVIFFGI